MLTVGSLFSGCGLFDLGFHQAGFETAWACEIDPAPRAVFRRHFPHTEIFHDVKDLDGTSLAPVDVLIFGSPCQDLSVAGRRAGLAGERSGLFAEAMRICDSMAAPPTGAVWENVPGALSSNGGDDFAAVLKEMAKRWRGVAYRVLDLQWFGVPQRRRRVFVVGHSGGWRSAAEVLFEREGMRWNPPTRGETGQAVAAGLTAGARKSDRGDGSENLVPMAFPAEMSSTQCATAEDRSPSLSVKHTMAVAYGGNNTSGPIDVTPALNANRGCHSPGDFEAGTLLCFDTTQVTSKLNRSNPKNGGPCHPIATGAHAPAIAFETRCARNGRGMPSEVVNALKAEAGQTGKGDAAPCTISPDMRVRRLMPLECERLMGAPDAYTLWGIDDAGQMQMMSDSARYRMLGNGVGVPVAGWVARRIAETIKEPTC